MALRDTSVMKALFPSLVYAVEVESLFALVLPVRTMVGRVCPTT